MPLSHTLYTQAQRVIPGGVNSPVRAFHGVGGDPVFFEKGHGAYLTDADGKNYIDYVGSWGPLILGHAHPDVVSAVQQAAAKGLSFGAPTEIEVTMAEMITSLMPNIEMVRMVNSGTEATLSAIRLARGYTKRNTILKFNGCYHGHSDSLLINAGSGLLTLGIPSSPGIPEAFAQHTLTAEFNDLEQVEQCFAHAGQDIAAVILEPVAGNMGCVLPQPGFLRGLRDLCSRYGSLLIFDEVMTGFRVALGGAQAYYDIVPDITTLGKIIGGGMPVGAFGGRRDIMKHLAPVGKVYQAGTLSGNPVTLAAGLATLKAIQKPGFYDALNQCTQALIAGLLTRAQQAGIALHAHAIGSMFGLFFTQAPAIKNYHDAVACHITQFKTFFHGMLERGVYLAPSAFEAGFVSAAHTPDIIDASLSAAGDVFHTMSKNR